MPEEEGGYGPQGRARAVQRPAPYSAVSGGGLNSSGYPLHPGSTPCAFYLKTGTCKFAIACRFDHPEHAVDGTLNGAGYPLNPGQADCTFFMKTGMCKFGATCRFNHPEGLATALATEAAPPSGVADVNMGAAGGFNSAGYPMNPGAVDCAFYMKTGTCKFAEACRFNHPESTSNEYAGTMGMSDAALYAEAGSNSAGYPLNPGQQDCTFYMRTGTCKFGANCKFNHPEGEVSAQLGETEAAPFYAEAAASVNSAGYPLNPAQADCAYYMKTGTCKFGPMCRFNHPEGVQTNPVANPTGVHAISDAVPGTEFNSAGYPINPDQLDCPFFMKTGTCKFAASCKFNHPEGVAMTPAWEATVATPASADAAAGGGLNSAGYPLHPGQQDCPFFMRTGTCKFAAACKFNHPDGVATEQLGGQMFAPTSANTPPTGGVNSAGYPMNPGSENCSHFMKTGTCKWATSCWFNHPEGAFQAQSGSTFAPTNADAAAGAALNTSGYPIHPDQQDCPFFLRTGTCKYAATCKFNHPEGIAVTQAGSGTFAPTIADAAAGGFNSAGYPLHPGQQDCAFFMKTGSCKFGSACHFNHPEGGATVGAWEASLPPTAQAAAGELNSTGYPLNPGQQDCAFYLKTGNCKFGAACKFNHPEGVPTTATPTMNGKPSLNSAGYPLNPTQVDCAFYMKTGMCKFGASCRFNHPEGISTTPAAAATGAPALANPSACSTRASPADDFDAAMESLYAETAEENIHSQAWSPRPTSSTNHGGLRLNSLGFPLRPGNTLCAFYLRTGTCKFGATCKNDHPERGVDVQPEGSTEMEGDFSNVEFSDMIAEENWSSAEAEAADFTTLLDGEGETAGEEELEGVDQEGGGEEYFDGVDHEG